MQMFTRKNKTLLLLAVISLVFASLQVFRPTQANADHDTCPTSEQAAERCVQTKRDAVNEKCFERYAGENDKIARCVEAATAHYTFAGSPANAPALPDTSSTSEIEYVEADCQDQNVDKTNCGIVRRIVDVINILTALVGIVAAIMLTVWGIQYAASRDNPQMVASARQHILQTVLAVIMYLFVYAFLQWLVPGGIL